MKQVLRYQALTVPGKLRVEVRLIVDDRGVESHFAGDSSQNVSIAPRPFIVANIVRPTETDENGQRMRAPWDPADSLSMTKYTLPIFLEELRSIYQDMKIPELYTYHGERLEINEEVAQKVRKVLRVGNAMVELSAQVIVQEDDTRVEGIKMKFNNEQHSVLLTLNDLAALLYTFDNINLDSVCLLMYAHFATRPNHPKVTNQGTFQEKVDILPK